jgi:hypothetical protein
MFLTFFPIYGCTVGISYTDSFTRGEEPTNHNTHQLQFLCFLFGVTIGWYTDI